MVLSLFFDVLCGKVGGRCFLVCEDPPSLFWMEGLGAVCVC